MWDPELVDYAWMADTSSLARRQDLDDVAAEHADAGVTGVVLVQAADNVADTELMLATARRHPQVLGVVAWVHLRDRRAAEDLLDGWSDAPVVGVRHLVHRDPDPVLLADPAVHGTLAMLGERGLTFDVCAESIELLRLVPELADSVPGTTFVVDHLAKPPIRERGWEPWAQLFEQAARRPNVVAKVSGLNTAAADGWTFVNFVPYVDHAVAVFGPDRLMYGGDWPFASLAADSYTQVWRGIRGTLDTLSPAGRDAVLAGTARRVYGLDDRPRRGNG